MRADIFRQLHGVTEPVLKEPLLQALARDPAPKVREEAAETLDLYHDDPNVMAWLRHTARQDPDVEVRAQAAVSLLRHANLQALQEVLVDRKASEMETYLAADRLTKSAGPTPEYAALLVHLLQTSQWPRLREETVETLAKHYPNNEAVRAALQYVASHDADPQVRREAASAGR